MSEFEKINFKLQIFGGQMKLFNLSGISAGVLGFAVLAATLTSCPSSSCTLVLNPNSTQSFRGQSRNFSISSTGCSFTGVVSLSIDNPASYPFSVTFNPQSGTTTTSQGTVTIPAGPPASTAANFDVTVRANNNGNTISANLHVTILDLR
jgi:hypothetical protein